MFLVRCSSMALVFQLDDEGVSWIAEGEFGTFCIEPVEGKSDLYRLTIFDNKGAKDHLEESVGNFEDCSYFANSAEDAAEVESQDAVARDWYYECLREQNLMDQGF